MLILTPYSIKIKGDFQYLKTVSHKIDLSKKDRSESKNLKISLSELRGQNSSVSELTEDELREALKNMRPKGAPGPDDISPPLLKSRGPNAIKLLLHIYVLFPTTGKSLKSGATPT